MIRNLTPHALNFVLPSGETRTLQPDPAGPARCAEVVASDPFRTIEGIPLIQKSLGGITGVPASVPGTALVVSILVAQKAWASGRQDVLAVGESLRDVAGKIIGATSLASSPGGFCFMDAHGN